MVCSLHKWSLYLLFQPFSWITLVLQIQTACVLLAVWISHTSFSLESFLSYSVPRAWRLPLIGSISLRLKFWNESTTFCSAVALTESSVGNQGIWKLLFQGGRRGSWGTIPMSEQCTILEVQLLVLQGGIVFSRFISKPTLCLYLQVRS